MHVHFPPEWQQQCHASHHLDQAICCFPSRLSHEAFPQGSPTCQRGGSRCSAWESILGVKVEAVQGKQVPLEWTETSGGLLEWWHDAGVPPAFPVESVSFRDGTLMPRILSRQSSERIPHLELRGGNGATLDVDGTFVLPLDWRQIRRGTSSVAGSV